jgi:hypothetical protein
MENEKVIQEPLPGFFDDNQSKPQKQEEEYESFRAPDYHPLELSQPPKENPFETGIYQDPLSPEFTGDMSESQKPSSILQEVAKQGGLDYILPKFNSFRKRIEESMEYVEWGEKVYAEGDDGKEETFIPVGGVYINSEEGMFMLHRNVDKRENKLGNTYYLTRHYKREKINGKYLDFVDFAKFTVSSSDDPNSSVYFEMLDTQAKRFPMFKDPSSNIGRSLYSSDYSKVPRELYMCTSNIRERILSFTNTKKPDGRELSRIYWLMLENSEQIG